METANSTIPLSSSAAPSAFRVDVSFLKTVPGILRVAQAIFNLLAFAISIMCQGSSTRAAFFIWTSFVCTIEAGLLLGLYICYQNHFERKELCILCAEKWISFRPTFLSFLHVIGIGLIVSNGHANHCCDDEFHLAACVFGVCAIFTYVLEVIFRFKRPCENIY